MIDGYRLSRKNTIIKLISLLEKMSQRGLWLTYVSAEAADENLRTPRRNACATEMYLKRGARTSIREKKHVVNSGDRLDTEEYVAQAVSSSFHSASKGKPPNILARSH